MAAVPDGEESGRRDDLGEGLRRRGLTRDEERPDAGERRHTAGGRTARENLADLVEPGSFVEYGRFAIAAQRGRRELEDLIARTPADGLIGGTAQINGELFGERAACAVLSYDYTVLAGTQGALGHRKKDRLLELIERTRPPPPPPCAGRGGVGGRAAGAAGSPGCPSGSASRPCRPSSARRAGVGAPGTPTTRWSPPSTHAP